MKLRIHSIALICVVIAVIIASVLFLPTWLNLGNPEKEVYQEFRTYFEQGWIKGEPDAQVLFRSVTGEKYLQLLASEFAQAEYDPEHGVFYYLRKGSQPNVDGVVLLGMANGEPLVCSYRFICAIDVESLRMDNSSLVVTFTASRRMHGRLEFRDFGLEAGLSYEVKMPPHSSEEWDVWKPAMMSWIRARVQQRN